LNAPLEDAYAVEERKAIREESVLSETSSVPPSIRV
jgi:hypothetical protein